MYWPYRYSFENRRNLESLNMGDEVINELSILNQRDKAPVEEMN
jgi:hypothetical protein